MCRSTFAPATATAGLAFTLLAACASPTGTGGGPAGAAGAGPREPSFRAPVPYAAHAYALVPTDFDGDGHLDLVISMGDSNIGMMRNGGDGTFSDPLVVQEPAFTRTGEGSDPKITAADINGDGTGDVVFTATSGNMNVLFGSTWGTPPKPSKLGGIDPTSALTALAAADVNGDGIPDIVQCKDSEAGVTFLTRSGSVASRAYLRDPVQGRCATGDFNGDGKADIAVVTDLSSIAIELTQSDGTLPSLGTIYPAGNLLMLTSADVDGDGRADVVGLANEYPDFDLVVWLAHVDGTLAAPIHSPGLSKATNGVAIAFADFNRDGHLDAVVMSGGVTLMLGDGAGGYTKSAVDITPPGDGPVTAAAAGDFDSDGAADIALGYGTRTYVVGNSTR